MLDSAKYFRRIDIITHLPVSICVFSYPNADLELISVGVDSGVYLILIKVGSILSIVRAVFVAGLTFVAGIGADETVRHLNTLHATTPRIAHVGILVSDMDNAITEWRALGYSNIQISTPDKGIDRHYHNLPIDCTLKQAFIKGSPDIELLQPVCNTPNPWASELHEQGMQLHHLAFYAPDAQTELEKAKQAGLTEIAEGKWKDNQPGYGEFFYVRKPGDALIIEYLAHTKS